MAKLRTPKSDDVITIDVKSFLKVVRELQGSDISESIKENISMAKVLIKKLDVELAVCLVHADSGKTGK